MDILDLLKNNGINPKWAATTNGGEYSSACPGCGGDDRFRVWPNAGKSGRYWCRGCGMNGDAIQYLKDFRGMGFREACEYLNITIERKYGMRNEFQPKKSVWTPKAAPNPLEGLWQERTKSFVKWAQNELWKDAAALDYLKKRGLNNETIKMAGLGWNPQERYTQRSKFGLPHKLIRNGEKSNHVWLPKGWVIPCWYDDKIVRVRIRRAEINENDDRYIMLSGSRAHPMMILSKTSDYLVVVESELDAWLLFQQAGDLAAILATGSAQSRPDAVTCKFIDKVRILLIALDSDTAGAKEAWNFWLNQYGNAVRWPIPNAKDPGDAFVQGLDLRMWVLAGLPKLPAAEKMEAVPNPAEFMEGVVREIDEIGKKIMEKFEIDFEAIVKWIGENLPDLKKKIDDLYLQIDNDIYGRFASGELTMDEFKLWKGRVESWEIFWLDALKVFVDGKGAEEFQILF